MPGSLDNPVILDPAQIITEVGWSPFTHVAFSVPMAAATVRVHETQFCTPAVLGPPVPPGWDFDWLRDNTYRYTASGQVTDTHVRRNGTWQTPSKPISVNGLPDISGGAFTHGAWELNVKFNALTNETLDGDELSANANGAAAFRPDTGSDTEIEVPQRSEFFQTGVTPTFGILSFPYTGSDPSCITDGVTNAEFRPISTSEQYSDLFAIPLAGITAGMEGSAHVYEAIAARLIPLPSGGDDLARRAWFLCQRQDLIS